MSSKQIFFKAIKVRILYSIQEKILQKGEMYIEVKNQMTQNSHNLQFEERVRRQASGPSEIISSLDGQTLLAKTSFEAAEMIYEKSSHLMIIHVLAGGGEFLRKGDWGKLSGVLHPKMTAFALPETQAIGFSPKVDLLGISLSQDLVDDKLSDYGGRVVLEKAACEIHHASLLDAVLIAMWRDAQTHGLTSAFFDHGLDVILRSFSACRDITKTVSRTSLLSPQELGRIREIIESQLDQDLKVSTLADDLCWDKRSFSKAFKATTGYAPFQYLTWLRMEKAKRLLTTQMPIIMIAMEVGYSNPAKFAAAFRRVCGDSPSQWRQLQQSKDRHILA